MTVNTNDTLENDVISGVGPYAFSFRIFNNTDLAVNAISTATPGVPVLLSYLTHYTVTGANLQAGGSITLTSAAATTYAGYTLDIRSNTPQNQPTSIRNQARFLPEIHEDAFDYLSRQIQDANRRHTATIHLPDNETLSGEVEPAAVRKGRYLVWDAVTGAISSALSIATTALTQGIFNAYYALTDDHKRTAAEIAAAVTPVNYFQKPYYVLRYGADPTGVASSKQAFIDAIRSAEQGNNNTIWVDDGTYLIDGEVLIHQGVKIRGFGSQGSTEGGGFFIKHAANGNCFKWDGNGISSKGTGGGLYHCTIVKQNGFSGGHAIELLATDDNHRPTEFVFHDVLIYGTGTGMWSRGLLIDGTACTTAGSKGVRDIGLFKVRVATCSTNNEYIKIAQGVHVNGSYVQIDTAGGSGTCGMTISNDSGPINISALELNGNLVIGDNADQINLQGHIGGTLAQSGNTSATGSVIGSISGAVTTISKNFRVVSYHTDAFHAYLGSSQTNTTGDGTAYDVPFDTERFDANSTHSGGTATIKCAGLYGVMASVFANNLGAAHTTGQLEIIHKDSGGTTVSVTTKTINIGAIRNAGNQASLSIEALLSCSKDDTVKITLTVSGSTKTVGVVGDANTSFSYLTMKNAA